MIGPEETFVFVAMTEALRQEQAYQRGDASEVVAMACLLAGFLDNVGRCQAGKMAKQWVRYAMNVDSKAPDWFTPEMRRAVLDCG